ncbi:hypothetical protein O9K51_04678 [Purpureocillium lavendulum]|uniref:Uncharacterized protein n=1 Tax=Purpureocillium lavendulum TaxID=1247861 RepID=A0AB34FVW9_9HYPO|nr:hypothetical protein O9K51_04678 [Purpureocillium lavendulum]
MFMSEYSPFYQFLVAASAMVVVVNMMFLAVRLLGRGKGRGALPPDADPSDTDLARSVRLCWTPRWLRARADGFPQDPKCRARDAATTYWPREGSCGDA